ncbi:MULTISPECIES: hypothetical protein [Sporomusa]|jgi:hypothetical protein|nr:MULTISPECIES: hypothetical protein [Sporomusa]
MLLAQNTTKQQAGKPEARVWPLRGSLMVFAGIVYLAVLLA